MEGLASHSARVQLATTVFLRVRRCARCNTDGLSQMSHDRFYFRHNPTPSRSRHPLLSHQEPLFRGAHRPKSPDAVARDVSSVWSVCSACLRRLHRLGDSWALQALDRTAWLSRSVSCRNTDPARIQCTPHAYLSCDDLARISMATSWKFCSRLAFLSFFTSSSLNFLPIRSSSSFLLIF
jgi:hypothetical protein